MAQNTAAMGKALSTSPLVYGSARHDDRGFEKKRKY
jgi:hypothetical protein